MEVNENEIVELIANTKDIDDGNMVVFQIWKEGQDPNSQIPYNKLDSIIKNGEAKVKWCLTFPENIPEEDPKFFFTVHSAWCTYKKSDLLTIKIQRPKIFNLQWQIDNINVSKAFLHDEINISFDTADIVDKEIITIDIYDDKNKVFIETINGQVIDNKLSVKWQIKTIYNEDFDNMLNTPEYYFIPYYNKRIKVTEKSLLKLYGKININLNDENDNSQYLLVFSDKSEILYNAQNGKINLDEVPLGKVQFFHMWG